MIRCEYNGHAASAIRLRRLVMESTPEWHACLHWLPLIASACVDTPTAVRPPVQVATYSLGDRPETSHGMSPYRVRIKYLFIFHAGLQFVFPPTPRFSHAIVSQRSTRKGTIFDVITGVTPERNPFFFILPLMHFVRRSHPAHMIHIIPFGAHRISKQYCRRIRHPYAWPCLLRRDLTVKPRALFSDLKRDGECCSLYNTSPLDRR
jgi:hypothetical protein